MAGGSRSQTPAPQKPPLPWPPTESQIRPTSAAASPISRDFIRQRRHQRRILRPAARNNQLREAAAGAKQISRLHRESTAPSTPSRWRSHRRRHPIIRRALTRPPRTASRVFVPFSPARVHRARKPAETPRKLPPKFLAPCRLRRPLPEKTPAQEFLNHIHPALSPTRRCLPSRSNGLPKKLLGQRIHHHVPRPGIKCDDVDRAPPPPELPSGWQCLRCFARCDPTFSVAIKNVVKVRHQRRALAARCHVRRTKIRHHRNPHPRRNQRGLSRSAR